jgi:hypothetical protein
MDGPAGMLSSSFMAQSICILVDVNETITCSYYPTGVSSEPGWSHRRSGPMHPVVAAHANQNSAYIRKKHNDSYESPSHPAYQRAMKRVELPKTIVTAANANHFNTLRNMYHSVVESEPTVRIFIYDLGFGPEHRHEIDTQWTLASLRQFPFQDYPDFFDLDKEAGQYAWKPIIVRDVVLEQGGLVLWMDAGDIVHRSLQTVWNDLATHGVYSTETLGTVKEYVVTEISCPAVLLFLFR